MVIELVPSDEGEAAAKQRAERAAWLVERDYRVVNLMAAEVERDIAGALDGLAAVIAGPSL
jgi:tRNA/rRNA methyltransferase